jgi:four helix bundle protein
MNHHGSLKIKLNVMHRFKELRVWYLSVELAVDVYKMTKNYPLEERFGLTSQMRRCGVSIASNVAEGAGRNSDGEFIQFLGVSEGSANELFTQALISNKLNYLSKEDFRKIETSTNQIKDMIFRLKRSLGFKS